MIIIPKGSHRGRAPAPNRSDFVYLMTKRLAAQAGFKRPIYPYLIKPSAITTMFNDNVNPRIIQRMARHKNLDTTLRYDHADDTTVQRYLQQQYSGTPRKQETPLTPVQGTGHHLQDRKLTLLDKYIAGDMDAETFKRTLAILTTHTDHDQGTHDPAYS